MAPNAGAGPSSPSPATQRLFTVRPHPPSASTSQAPSSPAAAGSGSARNGKKVYVAAHVLKAAKIGQGDAVMVKPALKAEDLEGMSVGGKGKEKVKQGVGFFVGTAQPSFTLDSSVIELSAAALMTASLSEGDLASLTPLPPIVAAGSSGKSGGGMKLPLAGRLVVEEVVQEGKRGGRSGGSRRVQTAVEDILLDHRYLSPGQFISVPRPSRTPELASLASPTPPSRTSKARSASPFVPAASPSRSRTPVAAPPTLFEKPRPPRLFRIVSLEPVETSEPVAPSPIQLFVVTPESSVIVLPPPGRAAVNGNTEAAGEETRPTMDDIKEMVGGLEEQIAKIRELVELPLTRPELYSHFGLTPPRGILLHGPPGTGKSLLSSLLARSLPHCCHLTLSPTSLSSPYHGETEQALQRLFDEAKRKSPCVVICDEVDGLCPRREEGGEVERRVVGTILQCLDGLHEPLKPTTSGDSDSDSDASSLDSDSDTSTDDLPPPRVVVIATTNRPNALDPSLRRPGRFDHEIEIPTPTASAREDILKVLLRKTPCNFEGGAGYLAGVAARTHGFVGADLVSLVHTAGLNAIKRSLASPTPALANGAAATPIDSMRLVAADVEAALLVTRPSAMREVFIETPKVLWSDIGGQSLVKQRLRESVEWPIKHPHTFKHLGIRPPRGVLLYGPPGCSKTLTARALATEGGLNFIAVKGPEVFSKYVGESEKAIRDVFGKARAAAPSIVFIDEIDAIAMSRGGDDGGSGTGDRVLTSLLTEMDGVEELNGVLVLAATNRPDVLDSALLRPGRLDRILYVGPPDRESRVEIFKINFRRMAVADDVDAEELADLTDGCTGAELVSVCQDAAMNAMNEDLDAPNVKRQHFIQAAGSVRRRTTPEVVAGYEEWRDRSGVRSA